MDKVRKPSNSVCYTPTSEPYRKNILPYSFTGMHFTCGIVTTDIITQIWVNGKQSMPRFMAATSTERYNPITQDVSTKQRTGSMPLTRNTETPASKFTQRIAHDRSIMFCCGSHRFYTVHSEVLHCSHISALS
jgi:hypothetical protein